MSKDREPEQPEQPDATAASRRERRRERREAEKAERRGARPAAAEPEDEPGAEPPTADEGEDYEDEDEDEDDTEADGSDEDAPGGDGTAGTSQEDAEPPPNRKQRRAARSRGEDTEVISRDRNQRLKEAAARRRERRDREAAIAAGLDAGEIVEDAMARTTHRIGEFFKRHGTVIQAAVLVTVVGAAGFWVWKWNRGQVAEVEGDALYAGTRILVRLDDPRQVYESEDKRVEAARAAYEKAAAQKPGSPTATLARLGLAGALYDQGKYDDARSTYEAVKTSALAQSDADLRARAQEGIGLSLESKGDLPAALEAYKALEASGVPGFGALGALHRARVLLAQGDREGAKAALAIAREKQGESKDKPSAASLFSPGYLARATHELAVEIDPAAAEAQGPLPGSPEDAMRQIDELQKTLGKITDQIPGLPADLQPAPAGSGAP